MRMFLLVAIAAAAMIEPALAQVTPSPPIIVAAPSTSVSLYDLLGPWMTALVGAIVTVVMAGLGWLQVTIQKKTGIQIDALRSSALQTAVENGAGKVIMLLGDKMKDVKIDLKHPAVKEAILYVNQAVPDAVKHFGLLPDQIAEKIIAKIGILTAGNPESAPSTSPNQVVVGTPPSGP